MGALCGLVLGVTLTTAPNPNPNPDLNPNLSPNPHPDQVLGAFVLVVGVCCRVVTFHVGYRSSNTHHRPISLNSPRSTSGRISLPIYYPQVGVVVCISLPLVSLWANFLGSALPLLAVRLGKNPCNRIPYPCPTPKPSPSPLTPDSLALAPSPSPNHSPTQTLAPTLILTRCASGRTQRSPRPRS